MRLEEEELSIFFYYWHNRITDFSLNGIWLQALFRVETDIDISRLKRGEIFPFEIEFPIYQNIPANWKKYFISLCSVCKKAVNIHLSRPVKYCPNCARLKRVNDQQMRRAIKKGRICKYCGAPLPKKYPNREYCPGGACKQKAYRERKEHESLMKNLNEFRENDCKI